MIHTQRGPLFQFIWPPKLQTSASMTSAVTLTREQIVELTRKGLEEIMNAEVTKIEPHHYSLRQSSCVVGMNVYFANGDRKQIWAKTLHPGGSHEIRVSRAIRDFDMHRFLWRKLDAQGPFRVAHAIYHAPQHRLIVTEHVAGATLQRRIRSEGRIWHFGRNLLPLAEDCKRVGAWLKAFQTATSDYFPGKDYGHPAPRPKDATLIVEQAQSRLDELLAKPCHLFSQGMLRAIRDYLSHQASIHSSLAPSQCCIHGDFFADNIFVHSNYITGLDFTSVTWGIPEFDPAYFLYQLETQANNPSYTKQAIFKLSRAFIDGYFGELKLADYWQFNPMTRLLFVTLSLSRMLALSERARSRGFGRVVVRKQAIELQRRLIAHIEYDANNPN
jgi:hypothetical protein